MPRADHCALPDRCPGTLARLVGRFSDLYAVPINRNTST